MPSLSLDFFAGLAHELRTPLGAIGGYAELIELGVHGPVTPAQVDGLQRIRRNQQLMVSLIGAFMAYAEVASGGIEHDVQTIEMLPAVRDAIDLIAARAHEKGVTLTLDESAESGALTAPADSSALATILSELLLDAVESSTPGAVVRLALSPSTGGAALHITSTGDPIPADVAEFVFTPFDQRGRGNRSSASAHALSLPHARALARATGGEVRVVPSPLLRSLSLSFPA